MAKMNVLVPGDAVDAAPADEPMDPKDARIAELEATVAQLNAALKAKGGTDAASDTDTGSRLIGADWSSRTSAEAQAAGVNRPVLCSDGYYVP